MDERVREVAWELKRSITQENIDAIAVNIKLLRKSGYLDDIMHHIVIDLIVRERYDLLIFSLKVSNSLWGFACGYASNLGEPELMERMLNACKL